jgi:predicted Zn-dependent protease with MMP-like domain
MTTADPEGEATGTVGICTNQAVERPVPSATKVRPEPFRGHRTLGLGSFDPVWAGWLIVAFVVVIGVTFVILVVRSTHPTGPVRRRRRHAAGQKALADRLSRDPQGASANESDKLTLRRLRRLERTLAPNLSESQRHWFESHLDGERYRQALESLAKWTVDLRLPVSPLAQDELLSIANSLGIKGTMLGILHSHDSEPHRALHSEVNGKPGIDVPLEEFEELVGDSLDSLPEEFLKAMTNVAITVEEQAQGRDLFGLYVGVPLTKRYYGAWYANPDQIFIYRKTICEHCRTKEDVRNLVHTTVVHEIAHHFGISDPRLHELGWG